MSVTEFQNFLWAGIALAVLQWVIVALYWTKFHVWGLRLAGKFGKSEDFKVQTRFVAPNWLGAFFNFLCFVYFFAIVLASPHTFASVESWEKTAIH